MISLSRSQFLPAMILISVLFVPIVSVLIWVSFLDHILFLFVGLLLVIYLILALYFFRTSRSQKNYLIMNDDGLDICCGNQYCNKDTGIWKISYAQIRQIDYYKLSSPMGWFSLWNGLLPKCVFLTFRDLSGKEISVFIGYLEFDQVNSIAKTGGIELLVH